jgi:hypothetical protein
MRTSDPTRPSDLFFDELMFFRSVSQLQESSAHRGL